MAKELLVSVSIDDCEVQTFRTGGNGGQAQNKTSSGVRIIHRPSGARAESREHRSQHQNKVAAFKKLPEHPKWKAWISELNYIASKGETVEETVARMMEPQNLRIEVKDERKRWVVERSDSEASSTDSGD